MFKLVPRAISEKMRWGQGWIHVCKKLPLALLQAEQIFSVEIFDKYSFFNLGRGFCISFSTLFPEALASCDKEILKQFLLHCTSFCLSSKSVSQVLKFLSQTGDVNIFVLGGVFLIDIYYKMKKIKTLCLIISVICK